MDYVKYKQLVIDQTTIKQIITIMVYLESGNDLHEIANYSLYNLQSIFRLQFCIDIFKSYVKAIKYICCVV